MAIQITPSIRLSDSPADPPALEVANTARPRGIFPRSACSVVCRAAGPAPASGGRAGSTGGFHYSSEGSSLTKTSSGALGTLLVQM
ncbi:hypothetical protein BRADI_2g10861v3 [Brachypodium distachyon]|uniref:Uncharacterized protein n=1 Tax=Brachypodium distachyon TaxID=15368 RepID=A0A0Q3G003_BRADI|nr:hypothetical protein BRADI_2g10861v3 [Brachypodium distachyon]